MNRSMLGGLAAAMSLLNAVAATAADSDARSLPMQFEMRQEGPADICGSKCRTWVNATGTVTAETPQVFEAFAKGRDLRGVTIALDSDGGSVLGAIAFGRAIRRLGMITTVGRTVDLAPAGGSDPRARLLPDAYCESMCTFVLLAGVERYVPAEARVLVHQIWLGDRRDDPTAATYSAEDLVLVQRDVGRLAQYTMEMGGSVDLLLLTLKVPPWEPMRVLSREDLRGTRLVTAEVNQSASTSGTTAPSAPANGTRNAIGDRGWAASERDGKPVIARRHPLTVQGDDIGSFEIALGCGRTVDQYSVTYVEQRSAPENRPAPKSLREVELFIGEKSVRLQVMTVRGKSEGRDYMAVGSIPAGLIKSYSEPRNLSLRVETATLDNATTVIRIGNVGLARGLPQLAASCDGSKPVAKSARAGSAAVGPLARARAHQQ